MDLEYRYEILRTAAFVVDGKYRRVAMQFPDDLLKDAYRVLCALKEEIKLLKEKRDIEEEVRGSNILLYVMADTTYGSCCVDEVGAAHVNADCVVHYGQTCLSPTSKLPVLFIFGKAILDVNACAETILGCSSSAGKPILVLFGLEYSHAIGDLKEVVRMNSSQTNPGLCYADVLFSSFNPAHGFCRETEYADNNTRYFLGGLTWKTPEGRKMEECLLIWIGADNTAFSNVVVSFNSCEIVRYSADECLLVKDVSEKKKILKRRYYLVEKAKDASMVGILVGTLGVAGYLDMIRLMKSLIKDAGKNSYTFVVGRPNPAKLANFPECGVFIHVACPQTALLDCKEFLAPVITPFEAMLAFSRGSTWTGEYVMEFQKLMTYHSQGRCKAEEARFSFLEGGYVQDVSEDGEEHDKNSLELAKRVEKAVQVSNGYSSTSLAKTTAKSGAEFLSSRSYQGLDVMAEPQTSNILVGRTGRASQYDDEAKSAVVS